MSLTTTREQLVQLLADEDNKVIALSGRWGTGKSFMWEQVKQQSQDVKIKGALYASLFGASSIDQVKLKLIQSAAKSAENHPALWRSAKQLFNTSVRALEGFHRSFGALNDLGLLLAPTILRQRVIVLDDIERKHEKLSIDEIMGFIDETTKIHGSRVVLILNDDQLDKREVWNTLREKVIDQQLRLTTSPAEAFEIATALIPTPWAEQIRPNIERCRVANIRIVFKVVRAVDRILGKRRTLSDAVLARVIPSTVLLAAIHYKGIDEGPDIDFVLAQGTPNDWGLFQAKKAIETEEEKRKSEWKILLNQLGIHGCDEFELLVVEYLQSGMFDSARLDAVINGYAAEAEIMEARIQFQMFFERATWDHRLTERQLLDESAALVAKAHLVDPYMATALHYTISELPGGQALADQAIDVWIDGFRAKRLPEEKLENFFGRRIHPRIEAEFQAINALSQASTSLFDACEFVDKNSGWGPRQELTMNSATVEEFEKTIRDSSIKHLQLFMAKMLDISINKGAYENHFGSAMDNFAEACRRIAQDSDSPRLANLVKFLFADTKIVDLLDPHAQQLPTQSDQANAA